MFGDDQRLAQVITNLISNAVKFTPDKGSIHVDTRFVGEESSKETESSEGTAGSSCTIQISVTDSGIGISPEQQSRLFQSFQQAESSTTRKFGGTGLGLSISKRIVEMMGGKIWIESELGRGATFAFTIQVNRAPEKKKSIPDWSKVRILAVDDDPVSLDDFKEIMLGFNAPCDTAESGEEALRLAGLNGGYDIYFVDWKMPGINGMELAKTLKANNKNHGKIFVVMMSAVDWIAVEEEAKKAGVDRFLSKPVFPSDIVDTVNDILGVPLEQIKNEQANTVSFGGYRILLAEDVEINREIVLALLEPTSLQIDCAVNGQEVIDMFKAAPDKYDLIFMDMQMPEMDGLQATRRIRAFEDELKEKNVSLPVRPKGVPIIAMTANVFSKDIENCFAAGMNGHISKPLNFDDVLDKLRIFLPGKQ
jgi:CheY-like chemotaxis protein